MGKKYKKSLKVLLKVIVFLNGIERMLTSNTEYTNSFAVEKPFSKQMAFSSSSMKQQTAGSFAKKTLEILSGLIKV
jgi:hypothetical protein